jgi:hypothetical protein
MKPLPSLSEKYFSKNWGGKNAFLMRYGTTQSACVDLFSHSLALKLTSMARGGTSVVFFGLSWPRSLAAA